MEIKNVEEEVTEKKIKMRISKKWVVVGILTVTIAVIGSGAYIFIKHAIEEPTEKPLEYIPNSEILVFNSRFERYIVKQRGANIKSLISCVIASNNTNIIGHMASINGKSTSKELTELSKAIVVSKLYTVEIEYANGGYIAEINIIDDNLE